jgi:hypothetical protein
MLFGLPLLESPLVRQFIYHLYEEDVDGIEDMKNYLRDQ